MKKKEKQNKKKLNIYLITNSIILAWITITTVIILGKYDVLPSKYMIPITIGMLLIPALLIFLMLKPNIKSKIKKIASGFSIFFIIIFAIALFYLNKTFKFLNNLGDNGYLIENYSVIVLNNDKYNDIKDIIDKTVGYYAPETAHTKEALELLDKEITTEKKEFEDYEKLISSLYNEEIDAMIMEESYRGIIEETNEKFSEETKVLYTIEVEVKNENVVKDVDVKEQSFNVYISGIDTYGKISSVSRSDVNIVATVNPETHQILLTTIPRDYYVQLDGTTGLKDKLTHAGIYGIDKSIKTIENLLDIEINYYVKVNFSSVERIVDALNGVEVYSEYTFTGFEGTNFKKGYNKVNGKQALEFARTRKTVSGGDRTRGVNQEALIQALLNKAASKEIITKYTTLLNSLEGTFQTNMSTDKITDIIKKQIDEMAAWNVTSISLDGANGREYTYSYSGQQLYVMIPDETTIENAKTKIAEVKSGTIFESSYKENNGTVNTPTKSAPPQETKPEEQPVVEQKKEEKQETTPVEKPTTEQTTTEKPTEQPVVEKKEETKEETKETTTVEKPTTEQTTEQTTTETPKEEKKEEKKETTVEKPTTTTEQTTTEKPATETPTTEQQ